MASSADLGVIWRVVLNDPVHFRDVQTSSSDIRAKQNSLLRLAELKERGSSLLLLQTTLEGERHQARMFKRN